VVLSGIRVQPAQGGPTLRRIELTLFCGLRMRSTWCASASNAARLYRDSGAGRRRPQRRQPRGQAPFLHGAVERPPASSSWGAVWRRSMTVMGLVCMCVGCQTQRRQLSRGALRFRSSPGRCSRSAHGFMRNVNIPKSLILLVGAGRFELPTPSPPDWCANQAALRSGPTNLRRAFDLVWLTHSQEQGWPTPS
jgi:hypothetical protein